MADLSCIVHSPTHEEMEVEGAPHELLLATQNDFKSEISAEPFHDTYLNISGKGQFATVIGYGTASCPGYYFTKHNTLVMVIGGTFV